ncbi:MAG: glycosyl hydrolase [Candidatus Hydrogenedentota bacterium]
MLRMKTIAAVLLCTQAMAALAAADGLEAGFAGPPLEARTRCYWWWLNGNVTAEAITRDIEEMKAKGFGGALIFDASSSAHRTVTRVPAGPMYGTPAWRALFKHAVTEADRLGLELGLNIQSGWNLGGPDVSPEEAAKQLAWSETTVTGPHAEPLSLPMPDARDGFYRDVAVLAYRQRTGESAGHAPVCMASSSQEGHPAAKAADGDTGSYWVSEGIDPGDGPTRDNPAWLQLEFEAPVTVGGVEVMGRPGYGPRRCQLETVNAQDKSSRVERFTMQDGKPATRRFDPVSAKIFRLVMTDAYDPRSPDAPRNVQVAEWRLLDADGQPIAAMRRGLPVQDLRLKAGFRELGGSAPDCRFLLESMPDTPGEEHARAEDTLDLTEHLDSDGNLNWEAPEGAWTILRFGYTLTGAHVSTASGDWQGPVLDYMSTPVFEAYWARHVQPLLDEIGPLTGKTLRYLHTDSWECGGMNWTPGFAGEFRARRGYDLLPYLPVFAGKIIESRDASNRFLADFRKTIAECVAENHYAHFAKMAHERGLEVHPESGGPHAGPLDGIENLGLADMPMGEFWVPSPHRPTPENRFFVKQAASAAHTYGRPRVAAEAFTSIGPHWEDSLWRMVKPSFDHEACAGLNLSFIHTFTCSPAAMGIPGQEYFAGTHFNPQVTWWDMAAGEVVAYMNRAQFLLQQGRFIADAAYYYGDHIPNIAQRKEADPAGALPGYDYDVLSEEVLVDKLRWDDERLTLPSGMRYRLLVLPDHRILSLAALEKVDQLVRAGATVLGPKPVRTASLTGGEKDRRHFAELAEALWGAEESTASQRRTGKGRVAWGMAARDVLAEEAVPPDCAWDAADDAFGYIHRRTGDADIYFVSNRSEAPAGAVFTFRVTGKTPSFWDPLTGEVRDATDYTVNTATTTLPLAFPPYGALFVVFRESDNEPDGTPNFQRCEPVFEITGPWTVAFDPKWGGPASVAFPELISWTERPEKDIRHYSGTATYQTAFDIPTAKLEPENTYALDLGDVREVASVRLNGQDLGVVWTPPFRADASGALRAGENVLEVDVVNNWPNRLIGDAALPEAERLTKTNVTKFTPDMPLTTSGLLGPVRLMAVSWKPLE